MGGTFDPIHFGHLRPALELAELLELDVVRMIPCHRPAHRESPGASTSQRIEMLTLATEGTSHLVVDTREAERDKPSYSVDTLRSFREEFPDSQLLFFMGLDAFNQFTEWYQWEKILELAHLVVVPRPGVSPSETALQLLKSRELRSPNELIEVAGSILRQPVAQLEISATAIRNLVAQRRDIRYLVPETVRNYIEKESLYVAG